METILTDASGVDGFRTQALREIYDKNRYLTLENEKLFQRNKDLEENIVINKQIICALVDAA